MKTPAIFSRAGILLATTLAGLTLCASASAASISLSASADTYIRSDQGNTNFSGSSELWVGQLNTVGGVTGAGFRSLLSFDLSAIPQNVTITSVTLTLYQIAEDNSSAVSTMELDLHLMPSFNETDAKWNNVGAYNPEVLSSVDVSLRQLSTPKAITWNSTDAFVAAIQQIYNDNGQSVSFLIKHDNEADIRRQLAKFAAMSNGEYAAKLNIEYAPIPESSSVALLVSIGVASAVLLRSRRNKG